MFASAVGLPLVFVIIMSGFEGVIETVDWRLRLMRVAWDLCVLAFGVMGHLFTAPGMDGYSPQLLVVSILFCVALIFSVICVIAHLRKGPVAGWKVVLSLALGGVALGFPSFLVIGR